MRASEFIPEHKASPATCRSRRVLGTSMQASCVSQGLRVHTSKGKGKPDNKGKSSKGRYVKGKKYGGPMPDYG